MSIRASVETITPVMAEKYLQQNSMNRTLAPGRVRRYARAMRDGEWKLNGEAIVFNGDGTLLDGQHRLAAIIEASMPISSLVVRGVESSSFDTIDTGTGRTLADVLDIQGVERAVVVVGAARWINRYMTGRMRGSWTQPTAGHIRRVVDENPGLHDSVRYVTELKVAGRRVMPNALMSALHYLFRKSNPAEADDFVARALTGIGMEQGECLYELRERFMAQFSSHEKLRESAKAALLIKAWNKDYGRAHIHRLVWRSTGYNREPFPEIDGVPPIRADE